jgi:transposase
MLTQEDDVDAHALRKQGWKITAIAAHLGHDRKTIRAYLNGERTPVFARRRWRTASPGSLTTAVHGWSRTRICGRPRCSTRSSVSGSISRIATFTRQLRVRSLRPHCERCHAAKGRPVAIIDHPAGEETQWDWVDLPDPPTSWGWGASASLFVGALAHSGKWRGRLAESKDQPHTIDALDSVTRALGGLTRVWRFDRMATVCHPPTGRSRRRSLVSPSTTGCQSRSVHRGVGTARVSSRRPTTQPRNAGGALLPTTSRSKTRRRRWTGSVSASVTPADVSSTANATLSPATLRVNG